MLIAVAVDGLFFPQRTDLGFDGRQSTPGFKRQLIILAAETRSFKRAALVMKQVVGLAVSANTIERICLEAGNDLAVAKEDDWNDVLGEVAAPPEVAVVEFDGGRIRTRKSNCGPGVHLDGEGWNETKNAAFVRATSETSRVDPDPLPPTCFLNPSHVSKLTEQAQTTQNADSNADSSNRNEPTDATSEADMKDDPHKPKRQLRTVVSSMQNSKMFGQQMAREAKRRRFGEAKRRAYLGDGLACNWSIQQEHFADYTPILDFTHAVSYLFTASVICFGKNDAAWEAYTRWMTVAWQGGIAEVLVDLKGHQIRIGLPPESVAKDDPREELRRVIGYLENNRARMLYDQYRCQGLPITTAWMESLVKEINYRVKGTEMFWNSPHGAEAILQIRAAALSDDDRLVRFLTRRPGQPTVRRNAPQPTAAA